MPVLPSYRNQSMRATLAFNGLRVKHLKTNFGPKILDILLTRLKKIVSLKSFKKKNNKWLMMIFRFCKTNAQNIGFL